MHLIIRRTIMNIKKSIQKEVKSFLAESKIEPIKIKASDITIDELINIIKSFGAEDKLKGYHGLKITLPSATSADEQTGIDLNQLWGKRNLEDWKKEWIKRWGDSEFIIDLNPNVEWFNQIKPINKKYNEWSNKYVKGKADFYKDLKYKGD